MRRVFVVTAVVLGLGTTGCGVSSARVDALEARLAALETAHTETRGKLQALLQWVNPKQPPGKGLYDWMGDVHTKLWPGNGPTDPIKPAAPPPPF
jgi:hypothetical protein